MTGRGATGLPSKQKANQQLKGFPCSSLAQSPTGGLCCTPNRVAVVALKLRRGSSAGTGPPAEVSGVAGKGGLDEKIVPLPARNAVGWVASPAIDAVALPGEGANPPSAAVSPDIAWSCGDGVPLVAVDTMGSTYKSEPVVPPFIGRFTPRDGLLVVNDVPTPACVATPSPLFGVVVQAVKGRAQRQAAAATSRMFGEGYFGKGAPRQLAPWVPRRES